MTRARQGLSHVTTDEGYLLKSLDPDGTQHGVLGAAKYGYFEAVCNHDAICFGVVPDEQARRIMDKIQSIPGLRPHDLIITNYPSLDDMYVPADNWLWQFGTWVNGGHWTTCEARMIMAYYRLGCFDDAARSMQQILKFARVFRLDNPLGRFRQRGLSAERAGQPVLRQFWRPGRAGSRTVRVRLSSRRIDIDPAHSARDHAAATGFSDSPRPQAALPGDSGQRPAHGGDAQRAALATL